MVFFTDSHEWIKVEGSFGLVGITDYAQKELGEIVYIELPKVGQKVKAGDEISVLESTKAAADIYSPVSGKVVAVNETVKASPGSINSSAENEGWLFRIELSNLKEIDKLLSRSDYQKLIQ